MTEATAATDAPRPRHGAGGDGIRRRPGLGLSGKLLLLTVLFVMLAEVLIYVPLVAQYRITWLNDRLAAAHTAALVMNATPTGTVPENVARELLESVNARAVALKTDTKRFLLAAADIPDEVHHEVDLRSVTWTRALVDAVHTITCRNEHLIRVVGPAPRGGDFLEIVVEERPLQEAMLRFSVTVLMVSLVISIITAALVYVALHYLFVRPMRRMTANMTAFHEAPENPAGSSFRPRDATRSARRSASLNPCSAIWLRC